MQRLILVDIRDRMIGTETKENAHRVLRNVITSCRLHRAFSVFMLNEKNELLMQRRSDQKLLFPGMYSNTCCSHPLYDRKEFGVRGAKKAAVRRMEEELGLKTRVHDYFLKGRVQYSAMYNDVLGENEMDYCFFARKSQARLDRLELNKDEVECTGFLSLEQLHHYRAGGRITPWVCKLLDSGLLEKWLNEDIQVESDEITILP